MPSSNSTDVDFDELLAPDWGAILERIISELECPRHKVLKEAMDPLLPRLRAAGLVKEVFAPTPLEVRGRNPSGTLILHVSLLQPLSQYSMRNVQHYLRPVRYRKHEPGASLASLHACTLVSKCWYELSRRHKFAIVKVTDRNGRFEGFFSFCYTQPDVVTHIRELTFVGGGERMVDWGVKPFVFRYEAFMWILPSLKSLRKLTFRDVEVLGELGLHGAPVAARAPLACIDVLEYRLGHVQAGPHFLMVLSSLLSVTSVGTLKISGQVHRRGVDVGVRSLVSLRRLVLLEVDFLGEYVGFLERILAPDTLRSVTIQCNRIGASRPQSRALSRFLSSDVARNLVSIDLDLGEGVKPDDIPEYTRPMLGAALAACTQLMYLRLGIFGWYHSAYGFGESEFYIPMPQPPMLVPLLTTLPPTFRILVLRLRVRCSEVGDWWADCVPYWDLDKLDDIFAPRTGRFPNLENVIFDVHPDEGNCCVKTVEEYDAPLLPELQAAGMLRTRIVREPWMRALGYPFHC